jgi:heavy metal sensor kinase
MGSLPIRVRMTLPFAVAMALVLAATGAFIYVRVGHALLGNVRESLKSQAEVAVPRLEAGRPLVDRDERDVAPVEQLLAADGSVVARTPATVGPLLGSAQLRRVRAGHALQELSDDFPGLRGDWQLLAEPVTVRGSREVLVLAQSLNERTETLRRLRDEFLIAAPAALLLATLAGYLLAAGALRPVEAMRRRAAAISPSTPGGRLPVPSTHDEISRLAETLNDMLARLEAAFEHERRFVADASHELRTPLALLRTELDLALRRRRTAAELEDALRSAAEETERLSRLAEDLLLIARSDQGGLPVRREPLAVQELLVSVADRFAARAQRLGRYVVVAPSAEVTVDADPLRLEQALGNLVDNALIHGDGAVELSALAADGRVELHVTDEGSGFRPEFVDRAFHRFSRADEARSPGGTGLGLAIVELIASAHGGTAGAGNSASGGADVWIELECEPERARPKVEI